MNTIKVRKVNLSNTALEFIQSKEEQAKSAKGAMPMAIKYLEFWMNKEKIKFNGIDREAIDHFDQALSESGLGTSSKNAIRVYLQRYFIWLKENNYIEGSLKKIFIRMGTKHKRRKITLPKEAQDFLITMGLQIKPQSLGAYRTALKILYDFLQKENLNIRDAEKKHMDNFLISLSKENLVNSTRRSILILLKNYLRWLHETGVIELTPDELIRFSDIPKLEQRLPRPLPPEVDKEIQKRLEESESILHQGLLVMRRTGIRIGELTALRYDCLKTNINEHSFLKVELGKLYTERLVPLHKDTVELIKKIQQETLFYNNAPEKLVHLEDGRMPVSREFTYALHEVSYGFKTKKPIVSHQFRHSFACEMLNCGMSLVVLKEILGHKDIKMTLQYATVTQGTIRAAFIEAYGMISKQYELPSSIQTQGEFSPEKSLVEIISYLKKVASVNTSEQEKLSLINRRLFRIKNELSDIRE